MGSNFKDYVINLLMKLQTLLEMFLCSGLISSVHATLSPIAAVEAASVYAEKYKKKYSNLNDIK